MDAVLEEPRTASAREEWTQALGTLERNVTEWAQEEGWQVHTASRGLTEDATGQYAVRDLVLETPQRERILVEVKGRGPLEASGRVQISAWPTLFRVLLLHKPGEEGWTIRTDSGIPIRQPWNRETFITLANDLLNAEQ